MAEIRALRSFMHDGMVRRGEVVTVNAADAKKLIAKGIAEDMTPPEPSEDADETPRRGRKPKS